MEAVNAGASPKWAGFSADQFKRIASNRKVADNGVIAVEQSGNAKIGVMSGTIVSQASCPITCSLHPLNQPDGVKPPCYTNNGPQNYSSTRVNGSSVTDADQLAINEAAAIDTLSGRNPLRVHIEGDCTTNFAADTVSKAAARYTQRGGGRAYTYTHAWQVVDKAAWNDLSVVASCETPEEVRAARERGYATAMIYSGPQRESAFTVDGIDVVPCPAQLSATRIAHAKKAGTTAPKPFTCSDCPNLCRNANRLIDKKITVGFRADGSTGKKINAILESKGA